jgi:hypothetical protein
MIHPALTLQWILWLWSGTTCGERVGFRQAVMGAMFGLMWCQTGAFGFRELECPIHGKEVLPNSCRRRDCPRCVGKRSFNWSEMVESRLLDCDHFHVVFTLSGVLHPHWRHNRRLMADLLLDSASATLKRLLASPRHMGGTPAILGVLHTHGSSLNLHPHVHLLVSLYGLAPNGKLVRAALPTTLLPYRVLRRAFQMEFVHGLKRLMDDPRFFLPKGTTAPRLRGLLDRLFAQSAGEWNVMVFHRPDPRPVVRYLSRTVYGGPLRDSRIVHVSPDRVTFLHHDWRDREEGSDTPLTELSMHPNDLVSRWSEHVAEPGLKTVRHWGLLAPGAKSSLDAARRALGQLPSPKDRDPSELPEPVVRCRHCQALVTVTELPGRPVELSPAADALLHARASPVFAGLAA